MHEFTIQLYGTTDEEALEIYNIVEAIFKEKGITAQQSLLWNIERKVVN